MGDSTREPAAAMAGEREAHPEPVAEEREPSAAMAEEREPAVAVAEERAARLEPMTEERAARSDASDFHLDLERQARRGYPEAVFCEGKTIDQVRLIAREWARRAGDQQALFTRCTPDQAAAVAAELPGSAYDPLARVAAWPAAGPERTGGLVVVVAAGTSDLPVAREAVLTTERLGRRCELVVDIGVAGLHRVLERLELLRSAACVVVVAGMDGALPSVVAGLVGCPVVACPTSVGYGAAFGGLAPLLSMLNSCAPGVGVVNIDNGYGAGHLAAQIAAPRAG